jgi:hypothetical protein
MGGVGKTAFAVHFAHEVADRFPGGQDFSEPARLRARRSGGAGRGAGDDADFARCSSDRIPRDLDGRAALWRTHNAGRRLLILLENAASTEQVRPLLPGPGFLVLVTSRWQLRALVATQGAQRVALDELAQEDAITLLAATIGVERVESDREAADRFIDYCGRLPLAIRILAVRADQFPDLRSLGSSPNSLLSTTGWVRSTWPPAIRKISGRFFHIPTTRSTGARLACCACSACPPARISARRRPPPSPGRRSVRRRRAWRSWGRCTSSAGLVQAATSSTT